MGIPPPQVIQPMNSYPWFSLKDFSVWGFLEQKNVGYSFPPFVFGEIIIKANFIITFLFVCLPTRCENLKNTSQWPIFITGIPEPGSMEGRKGGGEEAGRNGREKGNKEFFNRE